MAPFTIELFYGSQGQCRTEMIGIERELEGDDAVCEEAVKEVMLRRGSEEAARKTAVKYG